MIGSPGRTYEFYGLYERCTERLDDTERISQLMNEAALVCRKKADVMGCGRTRSGGVRGFARGGGLVMTVRTDPRDKDAFVEVRVADTWPGATGMFELFFRTLRARRGRGILNQRPKKKGLKTPVVKDFDLGKTIFKVRSPFQMIELAKGRRGLTLLLDGNWQFIEDTEHTYHEMLVQVPMLCAPKHGIVGIGGGGDGLAMREVMRWADVKHGLMCELDPYMIEVARRHPEMVRLNEGALNQRRAVSRAEDATKMLAQRNRFDVLVLDFPSLSDGSQDNKEFHGLYSVGTYRQAANALTPDGVVIVQSTDDSRNFNLVTRNLMKVFTWVYPIDLPPYKELDLRYVMASKQRLERCHAMPSGLKVLNDKVYDDVMLKTQFYASGDAVDDTPAQPRSRRRAA